MPTEKAKEDRVKKIQRSIDLDEMAAGFVSLAQEKRNKLVGDAQAMAQQGENTLRYAVETVFRKSEIEIPQAQVQIVKNPETNLPSQLTWEEIVPKDESADAGEDEPESEVEEPAEEKSAGVNGAVAAKRKLPMKG